MTDNEFASLQAAPPDSLKAYANRILYVLPGQTPSEADCITALEIFARVYGREAIAS
jgi:hypothetical protein